LLRANVFCLDALFGWFATGWWGDGDVEVVDLAECVEFGCDLGLVADYDDGEFGGVDVFVGNA